MSKESIIKAKYHKKNATQPMTEQNMEQGSSRMKKQKPYKLEVFKKMSGKISKFESYDLYR